MRLAALSLALFLVACAVPRVGSAPASDVSWRNAARIQLVTAIVPPAAEAPVAEIVLEPADTPAPGTCEMPQAGREPPGLSRDDAFASGQVVLTFDDGPYREKTPRVLDLLARHRVQAAFFVLGRHITRDTYAVLQRMEADGHVIASHSYDHDLFMAQHARGAAYIRGQHEITRILIELALLARSGDEFDQLFERVLARPAGRRISAEALASDLAPVLERHAELLAERGAEGGRYAVRYSRPPGGGPYLGHAEIPRARYNAALAELGMVNVMWHGQSGDVHETRATDRKFLTDNVIRQARRGGVLLIHDFIRFDALEAALEAIVADGNVQVLGLEEAIRKKYAC